MLGRALFAPRTAQLRSYMPCQRAMVGGCVKYQKRARPPIAHNSVVNRSAYFAHCKWTSTQRHGGPCSLSRACCILWPSRPEKYAAPHWLVFALLTVLHTLHTFRITPKKVCSASLAYGRTTGRIAYSAYFSYFFRNKKREEDTRMPPARGR